MYNLQASRSRSICLIGILLFTSILIVIPVAADSQDYFTGYIAAGSSFRYITTITNPQTTSLKFILSGPPGADFDLYVKKGSRPTIYDYDYRSTGLTSQEQITVLYPYPGTYYTLIQSRSGSGFYSLTVQYKQSIWTPIPTPTPTPIPTPSYSGRKQSDTSYGYLLNPGQQDYYTSKLQNTGVTYITVTLIGPPNANFDLYIKRGSYPTTSDYNYRSVGYSSNEVITAIPAYDTDHYIMVKSVSGSGSYTLTTNYYYDTYAPSSSSSGGSNTCGPSWGYYSQDGKTYTGYLNEGCAFEDSITITTTRATQSFVLTGPSGADFDLYVKKGSRPTASNYDYRAYGTASSERIDINQPTVGSTYYVLVKAFRGSGQFTLTAPYTPSTYTPVLPVLPVIPSWISPSSSNPTWRFVF